MQGNNPVFARNEAFSRGGYATFDVATPTADELRSQYEAPSAVRAGTAMTINDVVAKTALLFVLMLATAGATYFFLSPGAQVLALIGGMILTLVLGLVIAFTKTVRPSLIVVHALGEGLLVGGFSALIGAQFGTDLIGQAVLGTLAAFTGMLIAYTTRIIRVTSRFRKIMVFSMIGLLVLGLANIVSVFGFGYSFYFDSPFGILLGVAGVVIASLTLALDFDFIERGVQNRLPEQFSWLAGHGLLVTLVWLYIEILRLLAILRGSE
jgi:uncharacterized YccA/Bax inhibitor family protein